MPGQVLTSQSKLTTFPNLGTWFSSLEESNDQGIFHNKQVTFSSYLLGTNLAKPTFSSRGNSRWRAGVSLMAARMRCAIPRWNWPMRRSILSCSRRLGCERAILRWKTAANLSLLLVLMRLLIQCTLLSKTLIVPRSGLTMRRILYEMINQPIATCLLSVTSDDLHNRPCAPFRKSHTVQCKGEFGAVKSMHAGFQDFLGKSRIVNRVWVFWLHGR